MAALAYARDRELQTTIEKQALEREGCSARALVCDLDGLCQRGTNGHEAEVQIEGVDDEGGDAVVVGGQADIEQAVFDREVVAADQEVADRFSRARGRVGDRDVEGTTRRNALREELRRAGRAGKVAVRVLRKADDLHGEQTVADVADFDDVALVLTKRDLLKGQRARRGVDQRPLVGLAGEVVGVFTLAKDADFAFAAVAVGADTVDAAAAVALGVDVTALADGPRLFGFVLDADELGVVAADRDDGGGDKDQGSAQVHVGSRQGVPCRLSEGRRDSESLPHCIRFPLQTRRSVSATALRTRSRTDTLHRRRWGLNAVSAD